MKNSFERICKDIKEVKIQGAENVAKAALRALLIRNDKKAIKKLISLRATEPCLRNSILYAKQFPDIKEGVKNALLYFKKADEKLKIYGSKMIENGMKIFTHCHSSDVIKILIEAKKQHKKFIIYNTETRPLFQGRITAKELAKTGIKVIHIVDSAARLVLKKSDLFLFGADAITSSGNVINKIGTGMFVEIAKNYDVPCYSCTISWKFDPITWFGDVEEIEQRPPEEIWKIKNKNIKILNPAFEIVREKFIDGIISELGVLAVGTFISEFRKNYPFLFKK